MANNSFPKLIFTQFFKHNFLKIHGRRLYSTSLNHAALIEDAQLIFPIFHIVVWNFVPANHIYLAKFTYKCMGNVKK